MIGQRKRYPVVTKRDMWLRTMALITLPVLWAVLCLLAITLFCDLMGR